MDVLVIGGGVIGLSSAVALLETGFEVAVLAAEIGAGTTSAVAAAFWYPYRAYPEALVRDLAATSLRRFSRLSADAGVLQRDALEVFLTPVAIPGWASVAADFRVAPPEQLPPGFGFGFEFRTAIVETPIYLRWLEQRVLDLGGTISRGRCESLETALASHPVVVNCAGLGARRLASDASLRPVRGQLVRVENPGVSQVWIDEHSGPEITYIVPRSRDVVLGGTSEDDVEDTTPDPEQTRKIIARCARLEPSLAHARIVSVAVGLRPVRSPLRLAAEAHGDRLLVHNYGHGGAGVTLSWGCAEAVCELVKAHTRPSHPAIQAS